MFDVVETRPGNLSSPAIYGELMFRVLLTGESKRLHDATRGLLIEYRGGTSSINVLLVLTPISKVRTG
jgi:hypothetical protein